MSDVTCKISLSCLAYSARQGIATAKLVPEPLGKDPVTGAPYDERYLLDGDLRLPWNAFARFLKRWNVTMRGVLGEGWMELYARESFVSEHLHAWNSLAMGAARLVASPSQAYRLGLLLGGRLNMQNVSFGWTILDGGRMRLELWLRNEDDPSPELFEMCSYALRYIPLAMGLPEAKVTMTYSDGQRGVFEIVPPPSATLWARFKRLLARRNRATEMIEHMLQQEMLLQRRFQEVQMARSQLEEKVRERTGELAAAERRMRELLDASAHLIWSIGRSGIFSFANPAVHALLDPSEGMHFSQCLAGSERGRIFGLMRRLLRNGRLDADVMAVASDGGRRVLRTTCVVIRDDRGRLIGVTGTSIDATEERRLNAEIAGRQSILARAQALAGFGSWEWVLATDELRWSDETYRIFGYAPGSIMPTPELVLSHLDPDGGQELRAAFANVSSLVGPIEAEHQLVRRDGTRRIVREQIELLRDHSGLPERVIAAVEDVTLRKEHEASLVRAKIDADTANATKSAFLANMSHEIRTPLTAVLGYSELLANPTLAAGQRQRCMETISRNGRHLMELIDDLLDLSKVEAGHLKIAQLPLAPVVEIQSALAFLREQAEAKGLSFQLKFGAGLPPVVETDPTRLRQIVINLVGNAVKFTDRGGIRVNVDSEDDVLTLRVSDTGCGIPSAGRQKLFEPFSQLRSGDEDARRGGTGLGLALARRLALALGGDVTLERSETDRGDGSGSVFVARLPAPVPAAFAQSPRGASAEGPAAAPSLRNMRILVAGRDLAMRTALTTMLDEAGAATVVVDEPSAAVQRGTDDRSVDLVVLDLEGPASGGFEALATLRRQGFQRPVVALSASGLPEDLARCYDAGCDDVVAKPFQAAALVTALSKWARSGQGRLPE